NIVLDNQDQIHIAYKYNDYVQFISGFKYAVGTLQGVDENSGSGKKGRLKSLVVYPTPASKRVKIRYDLIQQCAVELLLYDVTGACIKRLKRGSLMPGTYQEEFDLRDLAVGVYFIVVKQGKEKVSKKILLIK
ncbi:MAG TPA: T9SS type A sorting domain-containing protein, partial [candidate division WOR-3 bacterium]|nr:T9SS type A sorting domain-containing protein [candidate division WOR-3 bacterium]